MFRKSGRKLLRRIMSKGFPSPVLLILNRLEDISRMTNWHESKLKSDQRTSLIHTTKKTNEEIEKALLELKTRRRAVLKDLYETEALQ